MAENARKKYLDFLKEEIQRYCNDKKEYELSWDYRDELSPESILSAYEKCQETGYPDMQPHLMDLLFNLNPDGDEPLYDSIIRDINQSGNSALIFEFNPYNLSEDLILAGYEGLDVNLDDLLSHSTIYVNVMFGTESEQNLDMGSIISSYGNDWQSPFVDFRTERCLSYCYLRFKRSQWRDYGDNKKRRVRKACRFVLRE